MSITRLGMAGAFALALAMTTLPDRASAATLNVQGKNVPDIVSTALNAVYTAATGDLSITQSPNGTNQLESPLGTFTDLADGSFSASADLTDLANPSGSLTIASLSATLAAVGNEGTTIELLWDITSDGTGAFGTGTQALTLLTSTLFQGEANADFSQDFTTNALGGQAIGQADTQATVVPVPAALPLAASALALLGALGWRRRRTAQTT